MAGRRRSAGNAAVPPGGTGAVPPGEPTRVTSPVFVGRRAELAWLAGGLARVHGGSPAALLIGGDAGIGKSRLVREFAMAAGPAARVLIGRCPELGAVGLPYAPFTAVLRLLVRDPAAARLVCPPGSELTRLLPELGDPGDRSGEVAPREARARLFVQMLSLLEQLGSQRPVVLVIEDAHWADESTRNLISFLIDNQRGMHGVMIVVTYRSDELHRSHPLGSLLAGLGKLGWVQRTELDGLSRDESTELTARILGGQPVPSFIERIRRRARGNPLFTEELLRGDRAPAATPRDLMLAAIRRLPEQTQDVLQAASVGGQRTSRALLAAVTGLDSDELAATLRPAEAAGVLSVCQDPAAVRDCVFRHALIGEALHQDLLPCEHTALHRRFATVLQADPSLVPAGSAAIERAEHWQHAHDPARALGSAWQAAAEAGRALGSAERLAMLVRVLELWGSVPDAWRLTGTGHTDVLRQAAQAADAAGETQLSSTLAAAASAEDFVDITPQRAARLLGRHDRTPSGADHAPR
ncbi:MAG TPA: AAA family ATPase [Streptosporangiaceae bacterium]